MDFKAIAEIERDAHLCDLVVLELPASAMTCAGSIHGNDYAAGFYSGIQEIEDARFIGLNTTQKFAYSQDSKTFPLNDITRYAVVERYKPDLENMDGLDEILQEVVGRINEEEIVE